jgi:uncharacterized protein YbbK (DUF523 family)
MTAVRDEDGPFLVSACLLGVACRYDGESKADPRVLALASGAALVPVCPEQLGGLPTPRPRHELRNGRVISEHGIDATAVFERGAAQAVHLAQLTGCRRAILKARSPSCGAGEVYDGTFSGRVVAGDGVLARALREAGLHVEPAG